MLKTLEKKWSILLRGEPDFWDPGRVQKNDPKFPNFAPGFQIFFFTIFGPGLSAFYFCLRFSLKLCLKSVRAFSPKSFLVCWQKRILNLETF